jgi:hypothetical protein
MQENNIKEDCFFGVTSKEQTKPFYNWLSWVQLLFILFIFLDFASNFCCSDGFCLVALF